MTTPDIPMGDDEFERKPYMITGRVLSAKADQREYEDGGKSTEHEADCVYDEEAKAGERFSCGENSGCTDRAKYYLQWDIERDDGRTSYESESWQQNDPINNNERGRYKQQLDKVNEALEEMGKPKMTEAKHWNDFLSDVRVEFEEITPNKGGRRWLKFSSFIE